MLRTPGPTPVPPKVLQAASSEILYHRSDEFRTIFRDLSNNLKKIVGTQNPVLTLTASGTGAAEAVIQNLSNKGEKGISLSNGRFGERWAELMSLYGMESATQKTEWGKQVNVSVVEDFLHNVPEVSMIWIVHCETSTGTVNNIQHIIERIKQHTDALICIDGVTSVGVHELLMDEWGIDVLVTASQKGLMTPPGLSFVSLSDKAWKKINDMPQKGMYFNLTRALKNYEKNTTPWTPAVSLINAAKTATDMILSEGMENVWLRHNVLADTFRNRMNSIGLESFSENPCNALSALKIPKEYPDIVERLLEQYNIRVSKGQEHLEGAIFRVAHMGWCSESGVNEVANAIEDIINNG